MRKFKLLFFTLIIIIVSFSCVPVPVKANANQLKAVYASIVNKQEVVKQQQNLGLNASPVNDSISLANITPVPAPAAPSWFDKLTGLLKWVIPGIIILLRIIPTSKNVDIIAFLNWILNILIPNLSKSPDGSVDIHSTVKTQAHRTWIGKLLNF